jgi:transposase-like protein
MKAKRNRHAPAFKAQIALEAIKAMLTSQQIAKANDIHPTQVSEWKKTLVESAPEVFNRGAIASREEDFERERERLHAKIGPLSMELDFLRKKSKQLCL